MSDDLRTRIAAVLFMRDDEAQSGWNRGYAELPAEIQELWRVEADPIIAILPDHFQTDELVRKRIDNIRQMMWHASRSTRAPTTAASQPLWGCAAWCVCRRGSSDTPTRCASPANIF